MINAGRNDGVRSPHEGLDVVVLNPAQVKENRSQDLLRSLKSDVRDLGAMAELIIRGKGRTPSLEDGPIARQTILVAHRRRKVKARSALKNQVLATLDLVFPGLDGCFVDTFNTKLGRLLINEAITPKRVMHMGVARLRNFASHRGVMVSRPKAQQVRRLDWPSDCLISGTIRSSKFFPPTWSCSSNWNRPSHHRGGALRCPGADPSERADLVAACRRCARIKLRCRRRRPQPLL